VRSFAVKPEEVIAKLSGALGTAGYKSTIVSVASLKGLNAEIRELLAAGVLHKGLYDDYLSKCEFGPSTDLADAKSIIITAARQPKVQVKFKLGGKTYPAIIPPTYYYDTDEKVFAVIAKALRPHGYRAARAVVRTKALAAQTGLAKYGKNNITYVDGWGSYFRLRAFLSDLPCSTGGLGEPRMHELCETCVACTKGCPTGAIVKDRFVFHGERCLCYVNESEAPFPAWVDPSWHNCLMGCMQCQDLCPLNKDLVDWVVEAEEFSEEETTMILDNVPSSKLPKTTVDKLKSIYMMEQYEILGRNLLALIRKLGK
jgi:epoxyqueuosine reductase